MFILSGLSWLYSPSIGVVHNPVLASPQSGHSDTRQQRLTVHAFIQELAISVPSADIHDRLHRRHIPLRAPHWRPRCRDTRWLAGHVLRGGSRTDRYPGCALAHQTQHPPAHRDLDGRDALQCYSVCGVGVKSGCFCCYIVFPLVRRFPSFHRHGMVSGLTEVP